MHPQFAEQYRQAMIERDDKFLKARWKLVVELTKSLTPSGALELIRLYLDLPHYDRGLLAALFDAVKDPGPQYARPEVTRELQLLAGAALQHLLMDAANSESRIADLTALTLLCCRTWQPTAAPLATRRQMEQVARQRMATRAVTIRQLPTIAPKLDLHLPQLPNLEIRNVAKNFGFKVPVITKDRYGNIEGTEEKVFSLQLDTVDVTAVEAWQKEANAALRKFGASFESEMQRFYGKALAGIPLIQRVLAEENNILWWLFGEASNDTRQLFAELELPTLCVALASELSDLTQLVPGPVAAAAYLDRGLRSGRAQLPAELQLTELATVNDEENCAAWRSYLRPPLMDMCPIMEILSASPVAKLAAHGVHATVMTPLEATYQLYQELLLRRLHVELVP